MVNSNAVQRDWVILNRRNSYSCWKCWT